MHVVNTHNHAPRYTALHYSCSVLCSLCTVSVQRCVAQSACVLRALSVHESVSFSDRGDRVNMHPSCPTCFTSLGGHEWVLRLLLSPPVLHAF